MNILVTGGAGFIGSHLSEALVSKNHNVRCLDNFNDFYDPHIKYRNIEKIKDHPNYALFRGDILDEKLLDQIFSNEHFDVIVHLAARAGVRPSVEQPKLYEEVNIRGTMNLLEKAKSYKIDRFILASSSSVYGNNEKVPFSETDSVDNPISPYAATKKACELIGYTYYSLYGISVSCLRFFTVYGPRQRPDMAIHKFTQLIDHDRPVVVYGDGTAKRDFTFIDDIIDGLLKSIDRCDGYSIYNLGESRIVQLMDLIGLIEKNLGKNANIQYHPSQPGDVAMTYADITKAQKKLDYLPVVDIEEGIGRFVRWYQDMNVTSR